MERGGWFCGYLWGKQSFLVLGGLVDTGSSPCMYMFYKFYALFKACEDSTPGPLSLDWPVIKSRCLRTEVNTELFRLDFSRKKLRSHISPVNLGVVCCLTQRQPQMQTLHAKMLIKNLFDMHSITIVYVWTWWFKYFSDSNNWA